jgi:hypothetical protein
MGLFSTKKVTYVSSVIYNMAGDEQDRPNYLKSLVAQHMAAGDSAKGSIGDTLRKGYINGPMMDRKAFFSWCRVHFPEYLMAGSVGNVRKIPRLDRDLASYVVKESPTSILKVVSYTAERADFFYWAAHLIELSYPARLEEEWTCDIRLDTDTVDVTFPDEFTFSFVIADYDPDALYFYLNYVEEELGPDGLPATTTPYLWTYKLGTGTYPELDALAETTEQAAEFYPLVPLRKNNISVRDTAHFEDVGRIYKKLSGRASLDELLDNIEDNEKIGDIDFAAVMFGVCVNDSTPEGKQYLYQFFRRLIPYQKISTTEFNIWVNDTIAANLEDQKVRDPAVSSLEIVGQGEHNGNYKFVLSWANIDETLHTGLGKPGAVKGDLWFEVQPALEFRSWDWRAAGLSLGSSLTKVELIWQTSASHFKKLTIWGMLHENLVYNKKSVKTSLVDGLEDSDESEFVVPLHNPTLRSLSLIASTQLCLNSSLLLFNCYKVRKIRWYERGLFKILLAIVIAAVSVLINPGLMATATGVLGTNLAVGTALGLTGLSAIILGAAANAIAGMILLTFIQEAAIALFGDVLGSLIGSIAGFFLMQGFSNLYTNGSFQFNWNTLLKPTNLLKLTEAGVNAYARWVATEIDGLNAKLETIEDDYEDRVDEILDLYYDVLGYSGVSYDPLLSAGVLDSSAAVVTESSDTFLKRTLMVGSDIVEISHKMINDFAYLSLKLPDPIP